METSESEHHPDWHSDASATNTRTNGSADEGPHGRADGQSDGLADVSAHPCADGRADGGTFTCTDETVKWTGRSDTYDTANPAWFGMLACQSER